MIVTALALLAAADSRTLLAAPADETPVPLVIVNGDTISTSDLSALLVNVHTKLKRADQMDFDYRKLVNKLVNDRLIIQEATALAIDSEPILVQQIDSLGNRRAVSLYLSEHYKPDLTIGDDDIQTYFDKNYSRLQVRTVSVPSKDEAGAKAADIRAGASMDSIARAESVDIYRYQGGLHKFKYYGDVENAIRDVADGMAEGEVSSPFPYRQVWAVLRVEQRAPADPKELEDHRKKIVSVLQYFANGRAWNKFIDSLLTLYPISEDAAGIADIRADSATLFSQDFMKGTDRAVFRIGSSETVTDADFRKEISHMAMSMATAPFDSIMGLAQRGIEEKLVLSETAQQEGYDSRPELTRYIDHQRDSLMIERYLEETVVPQIVFNRDEFDAYYREHIDDFREPSQYQFDRIITDDEKTADEISRRLADGADFYYIGKQFDAKVSTAAEAAEWLSLATFPEQIQQEIDTLKVGDVTTPRQTTDGWLILRLKAQRQGAPKSMEDVQMSIRKVMFQKKFSDILDKTLQILKDNSDIEYNDKAIDKYFSNEG
jgi:parvulin-like peptidyl-prolyl isomerase